VSQIIVLFYKFASQENDSTSVRLGSPDNKRECFDYNFGEFVMLIEFILRTVL